MKLLLIWRGMLGPEAAADDRRFAGRVAVSMPRPSVSRCSILLNLPNYRPANGSDLTFPISVGEQIRGEQLPV